MPVHDSDKFAAYQELLLDPEFYSKNRTEQAAHLDLNPVTLWRWERKIDWDAIREERRKARAKDLLEVDEAMFRQAQKGDVRAAELVYARWDGYIPTSMQINNHKIDESEIDAELGRLIQSKRNALDAIRATLDTGPREAITVSPCGEGPVEAGRENPLLCAEQGPRAMDSGDSKAGGVHSD